MTRINDLHWAAGLFEGEGTITIAVRNSDETYRLVCTLCSTDVSIVDFFQERWPCWKQPLYGDRAAMNRQPGWTWTTAGPRAVTFLNALRTYFRTSRVQQKAAVALAFREVQEEGRRGLVGKAKQRRWYMKMKRLNRRGSDARVRVELAS